MHHFLCLLLPRCYKFILIKVDALYSTGNTRGCKAWTVITLVKLLAVYFYT
jgi:hypothetical protein